MKIKCPLCGFENEKSARFCSNCNEPLVKSEFENIQKATKFDRKMNWIDKCPLCKTGKLRHIKKKIFCLYLK